MLPSNRPDLAFSLARDLNGLSEQELATVDVTELIQKVRRIHSGLSAEHEFAAIASWLGKCTLLTQPDQIYVSDGTYRAPDFLVVVRDGQREIPFLVEVKGKTDPRLVWSEDYLCSLQRFAALLKLPLLVAWKPHGMWVIADTTLFEKRKTAFHLTFDTAARNNLMSRLFGNAWLHTSEHFRFEIGMQILDPVDSAVELLPESGYRAVIKEAAFWTEQGRLSNDLAPKLFPILLANGAEQRTERAGVRLTLVFPTQHENTFNLSDLLLAQLTLERDADQSIDWSVELRKGLPTNMTDLDDLLSRLIEMGVLKNILRQQPAIVPKFLADPSPTETPK